MLKGLNIFNGSMPVGAIRIMSVPSMNLHSSPINQSRIKRVHRHKPMWHIKKLNKAIDEPITKDNKLFIQEVMNDRYSGRDNLIIGVRLLSIFSI